MLSVVFSLSLISLNNYRPLWHVSDIMMRKTIWALCALTAATGAVASTAHPDDALPSYHYGAPIHVECMKRNTYVVAWPANPLPWSRN